MHTSQKISPGTYPFGQECINQNYVESPPKHGDAKVKGRFFFINNERYNSKVISEYLKHS